MQAAGRIIFERLVGKTLIIIVSVRVDISENKNIDHRGKDACAIKDDNISFHSLVSSALNFCFLSILLHHKREKSY